MSKVRIRRRGILLHAALMFGAAVSLFPFYWTLVMATNSTEDIYRFPPKLTLGSEFGTNVRNVFDSIDFFGSMANTLIVACSVTVLVLFFDSLAAFTFAKFDFPGRRVLFGILLGTFMLPVQLAVIPQFITMAELGWIGDLKALIIPAAANAFGIFWMRQYIKGAVPDDLLDAARLDGARFFRMYWSVALPVLRPALSFLGIYTFISTWNDYMWPLIVLTNPEKVTLQVALSQLNGTHQLDYSRIVTGALLAMFPLVIVFTIFARGFIADLAKGAFKG